MSIYRGREQYGVFCYDYSMRVDRRLKYCPYGQAGVIIKNDGTIELYSYTTLVISITPDGWLTCTGTYSQTTRKHIGCFLREYAPNISYFDAKNCYVDDMKINVNTGEVKPLKG